MDDFTKVVRIGTVPISYSERLDRNVMRSVFCKIVYSEGRLSITGVVAPRRGGDCVGCGQIDRYLAATVSTNENPDTFTPAPDWTREQVREFLRIWRDWHLNDMRAGSSVQRAYLHEHVGRNVSYEEACEKLARVGLLYDQGYLVNGKPYRYGTAWLHEEVPDRVLYWLRDLPDTDKTPAWV